MKRDDATLTIERFDLRLPAGFERRGAAIVRQTLRLLADRSNGWSGRLPRVDVRGLRIQGGETDAVIARRICRAIEAQIARSAVHNGALSGGTHAD